MSKCLRIIEDKKIVSSSFIGPTLLQLEYLWYNIEKVFEDNTNITLFTGQCGDCIPNGLTTGALLAPRGLMKAVHGRCALFT